MSTQQQSDGSQQLANMRRERFAQAIVEGKNGKSAAIAAGYSERSASSYGYKLPLDHDIAQRIAYLRGQVLREHKVEVDRVLEAYAEIAFTGMSAFIKIDADGQPRVDLSKCTKRQLDALAEVNLDTLNAPGGADKGTVTKTRVKQIDRLAALEKLGRFLGMWRGDTEADTKTAMHQFFRDLQRRGSRPPIKTG